MIAIPAVDLVDIDAALGGGSNEELVADLLRDREASIQVGGGVIGTAVHREGQLAGPDLFLMEDVADVSDHPLYASGGITTMGDLRALEDCGTAGAIIGMTLYTGVLDARLVAEEFMEELAA